MQISMTPALSALESRFAERLFERRPYLYSWERDDALLPLEQALIEEEAIEAPGLWIERVSAA